MHPHILKCSDPKCAFFLRGFKTPRTLKAHNTKHHSIRVSPVIPSSLKVDPVGLPDLLFREALETSVITSPPYSDYSSKVNWNQNPRGISSSPRFETMDRKPRASSLAVSSTSLSESNKYNPAVDLNWRQYPVLPSQDFGGDAEKKAQFDAIARHLFSFTAAILLENFLDSQGDQQTALADQQPIAAEQYQPSPVQPLFSRGQTKSPTVISTQRRRSHMSDGSNDSRVSPMMTVGDLARPKGLQKYMNLV